MGKRKPTTTGKATRNEPTVRSPTVSTSRDPSDEKLIDDVPLERLQKLVAFEVAEEAKQAVVSWAKWIAGTVVAVAATLGIKTYIDINTSIAAATTRQIEEAAAKAKQAVATFEEQQKQALADFRQKSEHAIANLDAQATREVASVIEAGRKARLDILIAGAETAARQGAIRSVDPKSRVRPIGPGLSVSGVNGTAATICCVVKDKDGAKFILTTPFPVPDGKSSDDDIVVQPGAFDGGSDEDAIGSLERVTEHAALVRLNDGVEVYYDVPGIGPIRGTAEAQLGQIVRKFGRTSGLSTGEVLATNYISEALFGGGNRERQRIKGVMVTRFTEPGDAGSPVLNQENELLGMHFAGSETSSIFLPIAPILNELDVQLMTAP